MRIMHISTRLILGGSQENTVLSCEGQAERGHDVALVYGPIYGPEGSMLERVQQYRTTTGRSIEAIETPNLVRELAPRRDLKCFHELRRLIRTWKPHVVHTHSSKAGILGRAAAWRERVPAVIHTVHGPPFHKYEKRWRNAIYVASERWAAKRCHAIACVAQAMREQYLAKNIGRPEQYFIVYSGMDTESYLNPTWPVDKVRSELGLDQNDVVIGTIARLAELKGHDDLLDALAPAMQSRPELKLVWVGDGWWHDRLMQRVKDLKLSDRVLTTGLVEPSRIPQLLQAMDLLVHPSYREGLPRTVTQALLSGTPVVAYDVDGTREVCIDQGSSEASTGRLVQPGDVNALRNAVLWMLDHREEAAMMACNGRELCAERFSASRMVDDLEKLYENVLAHTRPHA